MEILEISYNGLLCLFVLRHGDLICTHFLEIWQSMIDRVCGTIFRQIHQNGVIPSQQWSSLQNWFMGKSPGNPWQLGHKSHVFLAVERVITHTHTKKNRPCPPGCHFQVRVRFRSPAHIAGYLLNYISRASEYDTLRANCQTFVTWRNGMAYHCVTWVIPT